MHTLPQRIHRAWGWHKGHSVSPVCCRDGCMAAASDELISAQSQGQRGEGRSDAPQPEPHLWETAPWGLHGPHTDPQPYSKAQPAPSTHGPAATRPLQRRWGGARAFPAGAPGIPWGSRAGRESRRLPGASAGAEPRRRPRAVSRALLSGTVLLLLHTVCKRHVQPCTAKTHTHKALSCRCSVQACKKPCTANVRWKHAQRPVLQTYRSRTHKLCGGNMHTVLLCKYVHGAALRACTAPGCSAVL